MKKTFATLLLCLLGNVVLADETPTTSGLFASTLSNINDQPVALERYRGRPLVVNFWARWCAPCRAEIPELNRFHATHKGKLEVLGIGLEDQVEEVREFARSKHISYPLLVAREKGIPLMQGLGNTRGGLPFTLFIDRDGRIIEKKLGLLQRADLDAIAPRLLKN